MGEYGFVFIPELQCPSTRILPNARGDEQLSSQRDGLTLLEREGDRIRLMMTGTKKNLIEVLF